MQKRISVEFMKLRIGHHMKMASFDCRALALMLVFWQIIELARGESLDSLIQNGNFEDVGGFYPAGVVLGNSGMNSNTALKHWSVVDGVVEILSSKLWLASKPKSVYAVHLNSPSGPGALQTEIQPGLLMHGENYLLAFDVATSFGGPALKQVEMSLVDFRSNRIFVSITPVSSHLPANTNSRRLSWRTVEVMFPYRGTGDGAIFSVRSLTPGSHGLIVDNIKLSRTMCVGDECVYMKEAGSREEQACSTRKSSLGGLIEKVMLSAEAWFRQRFLRPADW